MLDEKKKEMAKNKVDRTQYMRERRMKKKYGNSKRVCAKDGCNTVLNSYNFNMCCSLHHFEYIKKHKIKTELGSSYQ